MRILLFALLGTSAMAQASVEDVWLSIGPGLMVAEGSESYEDFLVAVSVQAARGLWTARLGYAESGSPAYDFSGAFAFASTETGAFAPDSRPTEYRTFVLAAGPRTGTGPLNAAVLVGPALTWGDTFEDGAYRRFGLGATAQISAQVVGPLWTGLEANGVLNSGASHAGLGFFVRIDLQRAPR